MAVPTLDSSREFLIRHGNIMLQEHASSYLLLASLEDEMNGYREKMRRTAHQSQILSNISELSKTLRKHPGNVVNPFFIRMQEKEHHAAFLEGVEGFIKNIIKRAVVKRKEMDEEEERRKKAVSSSSGGRRTHLVQTAEGDETVEEVDLSSLAVEERLGPGGLDPVAVFESLPLSMQEAFESREVEKLKEAVAALDPEVAEKHMRECVAAGLWNEG
uniref:Hsp90 chaperone protein kinase-targeting subunit n=1 Tax=Corethron hystrix TaxID=216773 RepID=A0A7S1BLD0_9STRA|mmetsp:Transcript_30272/g.69375  ORF Transcript_30272/g.69375 Transcript_30272/m.69375 type:complete len:216 (+) Transcript_30272:768-1415(+)